MGGQQVGKSINYQNKGLFQQFVVKGFLLASGKARVD
jgi:hypothetical protein